MSERELRERLRRAGEAEDRAARERAWRVVRAAHAQAVAVDAAPRRRGPSRRALRVAVLTVLLAAVAGAAGAATTTPHSGVGRLVRDVLGIAAPHARRALVHVPGGGRLLVQDGSSTWVVAADGARRRLGPYDGASWSPHGLFVVAWAGGVLAAAEPGGRLHWSLSRPHAVSAARWSPVDGFRIAYLSGGALRVVNGDGTGDHRYAAARAGVAPAWRPDARHVLAFARRDGRVEVAAVDAHRALWRSARLHGLRQLAWSPDGRRLLVLAQDRVRLLDRAGRLVASRALPGGRAAAWGGAGRLALVRSDAAAGTSELLALDARLRLRVLLRAPGRFGAPAWSPDGRTVLVPWPAAGQWLFLHPGRAGRPAAVANIARQFSPGAARPRFPGAVQWCCGAATP